MVKKNSYINANGVEIRVTLSSTGDDYISLTDIAKHKTSEPNDAIRNWLRNRDVIEFLGLWEQLHNPEFNPVEFDGIRKQAGKNAFSLSPQNWINSTNAIGIQSRAGRYGGTYAHSDIAFEFASWISPEFKLYIIKDYQRLKQSESDRLSLDWNARREIAKTNYQIHTDAIKDILIDSDLPAKYKKITYANEADVINVALFGITAKEWRQQHPKMTGNIRDYADIIHLIVLANMETLNAEYIRDGIPQSERLQKLRAAAVRQLQSVSKNKQIQMIASGK